MARFRLQPFPLLRSRFTRCGLVVAAAVALSAGVWSCGSSSRPGRAPEVRRAQFPIPHDAYRSIGYRLDWVGYPSVSSRERIEFLHADNEFVATLEAGSTVTLMSSVNGSVRWTNQLADRLTRFVGLHRDGNRIYASGEGELFILDIDTGNVIVRQRYEKIVSTRPLRYGGQLIYGTGSGEILAHLPLSAVEGVKAWGNAVGSAFESAPVLIGNVVGAVTQIGDVLFLDANSGSLIGRNRIFSGLATDPVANDEFMFVAGLDQSVWAFRAAGGSVQWRYRTAVPLREQPTALGGTLYCAIEGTGLVAFDAPTGRVLWTANDVGGTVLGTNQGHLVVWNGRTATLVDVQRGDVIARAELPGLRTLTMDRDSNGNLLAVSTSGVVARFVPR